MGKTLARILGLVAILGVILGGVAGWGYAEYRQFVETPLALPNEGVVFTVEPRMSVRSISMELEHRGYLSNALYLRLLARWTGQAAKLKAGEYWLARDTTPIQLLDQLAAGRVKLYSLTIVEGWTFHQLLAAIRGKEPVRQRLGGLSDEQIMDRLGHPGEQPEGRFLPETYLFPRGTTDLELLRRAYTAMHKELAQAWAQRSVGLALSSPYDALKLASIIEKETAVPAERAAIAGVFIRRLVDGMKLQTDPTVIYGLGERFDGNIRRADLTTDTPYNTYTRAGLPPTPICLPGRASIQAAVNPAAGDSLYFVARGDGTHQFSRSLVEHNAAVRKYQLRK